MPTEIRDTFDERLTTLVTSLAEWTPPNQAVLTLTAEADRVLEMWEQELEPQLAKGARLGDIDDWAGKLTGSTVRIAGLLHLARHHADGWARPIEADTMNDAVTMAGYFLAHALVAFDLVGPNETTIRARAVASWLRHTGRAEFTERDCFKEHRRVFHTMDDLRAILTVLEEHGWIQSAPREPRRGAGRPASPTFFVNPVVYGQDAGTRAERAQCPQSLCHDTRTGDSENSARDHGPRSVPEFGHDHELRDEDVVALIVDTFTTTSGDAPMDVSLLHCPSCSSRVVPAPGSVERGWSTCCSKCESAAGTIPGESADEG